MSLVSESPGNISLGIVFVKFPGPGKSWKMSLVLESPGSLSAKSWKVLESYADSGRNDASCRS